MVAPSSSDLKPLGGDQPSDSSNSTSNSIPEKKVRVSRFDQGPKIVTSSPIASTSTLPSSKADSNGLYTSKNQNSGSELNGNHSYHSSSSGSNRDDKSLSSSNSSSSYRPSAAQVTSTSLSSSSTHQGFSPYTSLPSPSSSSSSRVTPSSAVTSVSSSSQPTPSLVAIPTGPRRPTVYSQGPAQQGHVFRPSSYVPPPRHVERAPISHNNTPRRSSASSSSYSSVSSSYSPAPPKPPVHPSIPISLPSPHLAPYPPDHYKPRGTKDYIVSYDPITDPSPVKKGKEVLYRYDGEGIKELPIDPRKSTDKATLEKLARSKGRVVKETMRLKYTWDKNSLGPAPEAPPSSILITGFPSSTAPEHLHRHFSVYGKISSVDNKTDPKTGGSLGICWISYNDDVPRDTDVDPKVAKEKYERDRRKGLAQDGHAVAKEAVSKGNGSKIGARMMVMSDVITVVMDGDGKLTKTAVAAELLRRHPPAPILTPVPPVSLPTVPPPPPPPPLTSHYSSSPSNSRPPFTSAYDPPVPFVPSPFNNNPNNPLPPRPPHQSNRFASQPNQTQNNSFNSNITLPDALRNGYAAAGLPLPALPSLPPPPPPSSSSFQSNNLPSGPRSRNLPLQQHHSNFHNLTPHARAVASGRPLPTDPYVPMVFSGIARPSQTPYVPTVFSGPPSSNYKGKGQSTKMSEAVAAAVLAAKRRLYSTQKKEKTKVDDGEADMDLDSDASKEDSDDEDAEDVPEEKIFYHRDGKPRTVLPRGQAPAGSIAWQASPQVLRLKLIENKNPFLFIQKTSFYDARDFGRYGNPTVLSGPDLENHFGAYKLDRTFADSSGWYITFTKPESAQQAYDTLNNRPFAGALLDLVLRESPRPEEVSVPSDPFTLAQKKVQAIALAAKISPIKVKKTSGWTDEELIDEARDMVIADLMVAFKNDLKNRLVSGKVVEHLSKWEESGSKSTSKDGTVQPSSEKASLMNLLMDLPSFARNKSHKKKPPPGFVSVVQRVNSEAPSDSLGTISDGDTDNMSDSTPLPKSTSLNRTLPLLKKKGIKIVTSETEEEEGEGSRASLSKSKSGKKVVGKPPKIQMNYTSSEGGDSDNETQLIITPLDSLPVSVNHSVEPEERSLSTELPLKKKRGRPVGWRKKVPAPGEERLSTPVVSTSSKLSASQFDSDREEFDRVKAKVVQAKIRSTPARVLPVREPIVWFQPPGPTPDPFDAGVAADEEDLFYLKLAIERPRMGVSLHPTPPPSEDELDPLPRHPTGSARTEGYYAITVAEKIANRAPTNRAKAAHDAATSGAVSGVAVSRLARANTRGLVRGMELHKKEMASDTDVLKFNQLRTRKKQLTFSRSGIEGYGLFAMEHIPVGEMVIEYVGELIRQQVADRREKAYERQGIGSSYLFRVDEDLVVDATKKGNLGRLINHCCAPNCTARIITINGVKKIVIYAKTNIEPGDEVTYDYHFPHEEVKIPCLCAHPLCRKYLN